MIAVQVFEPLAIDVDSNKGERILVNKNTRPHNLISSKKTDDDATSC